MRVWLDADKLRARDLTVDDVVGALRQQNVQVAAGQIGQPPVPKDQVYQLNVNTLGRLTNVEEFEDVIIKTGEGTRAIRVKDVGKVDLGGKAYDFLSLFNGQPAATMIDLSVARFQRHRGHQPVEQRPWKELKKTFPQGTRVPCIYKIADFVNASIHEVIKTLVRGFRTCNHSGFHLPAELACDADSDDHHPGGSHRHVCSNGFAGFLHKHGDALRACPCHRFGRGRRNRRGGER